MAEGFDTSRNPVHLLEKSKEIFAEILKSTTPVHDLVTATS